MHTYANTCIIHKGMKFAVLRTNRSVHPCPRVDDSVRLKNGIILVLHERKI